MNRERSRCSPSLLTTEIYCGSRWSGVVPVGQWFTGNPEPSLPEIRDAETSPLQFRLSSVFGITTDQRRLLKWANNDCRKREIKGAGLPATFRESGRLNY